MVLIRPRCSARIGSASRNIADTIEEGHRAALKALEDIDAFYDQPGGVYPRRRFEIEVDRDRVHRLRPLRRRSRRASWGSTRRAKRTRARTPPIGRRPTAISSRYCPTSAIVARKIERIVPLKARRARRGVAPGA